MILGQPRSIPRLHAAAVCWSSSVAEPIRFVYGATYVPSAVRVRNTPKVVPTLCAWCAGNVSHKFNNGSERTTFLRIRVFLAADHEPEVCLQRGGVCLTRSSKWQGTVPPMRHSS